MRAGRVLVISAIAHAALFGGLSQLAVRGHAVPAVPVVPVAPVAAPVPIEVVMLDAPSVAPVRQDIVAEPRTAVLHNSANELRSATEPRPAALSGATAEPSATTGEPSGTTGEPTGTTGEPRGPEGDHRAANLSLDSGTAERIASAPHTRGAEPKITGRLEPTPGGGAVVNDAVTTMTVERDGNIKFDDKPDIDVKLKLPIPNLDPEQIRKDLGKVITDWYRDPYANAKYGPKSEVARHLTAVPGACDSWGDVMCDDPLAPGQEKYVRDQKKTNGSILGGSLDITAWLHRKFIGDPYSSRKLKLLDDTRDERIVLGTAFRAEALAHSAELIHRTLEELWRATTDASLRKEALFELWDDCFEGEGPRGEAGARARAMVIGWIRAKLPAGSPEAFTDEEIAACAARRTSRQPFEPY